jgi:hypothetical protein
MDVILHAVDSSVFDDFMEFKDQYGLMHLLDTRTFFTGLQVDMTVELQVENSRVVLINLMTVGSVIKNDDINDHQRVIKLKDGTAGVASAAKPKTNLAIAGSVGDTMSAVVLDARIKVGDIVRTSDPLLVRSTMTTESGDSESVSSCCDAHGGQTQTCAAENRVTVARTPTKLWSWSMTSGVVVPSAAYPAPIERNAGVSSAFEDRIVYSVEPLTF